MLIDSHCHLPHAKYGRPLEQVILDAMQAGVTKFINIGTSLEENSRALAVSQQYENVYSAVAIYPHEDMGIPLEQLQIELAKQLKSSSKIVALGECGLDITDRQDGRSIDAQVQLFKMQLQLAIENKLPVIIHNRGGDAIIFGILDFYIEQGLTGVAHCFSSNQKVADEYLKRGFYISFAGMLTYPSRANLREIAKTVPQERVLLETDAPYLAPQGYRGQVNEPKHVVEVAKKYAEITGLPFEKACDVTYSNTCRLFGLI